MIEPGHEKLSLRRQAALLGINRNRLAVCPRPARASWEEDQKGLRELDRLHTRWPFYGQRKLLVEMRRAGVVINRRRLRMGSGQAKTVKPSGRLIFIQVASWDVLREYFSIMAASLVWAVARSSALKMERTSAANSCPPPEFQQGSRDRAASG